VAVVTFGATEALGLASLVVLVAGAALAARAALRQRGAGATGTRIAEKLEDFEEREEINRLRHRDFPAFLEKVNERRAALGQAPLTREFLEPHQYNLMYSVDAADIDEAGLAKLRDRVKKSARSGAAPEPSLPGE
jgi:hypothetical protein